MPGPGCTPELPERALGLLGTALKACEGCLRGRTPALLYGCRFAATLPLLCSPEEGPFVYLMRKAAFSIDRTATTASIQVLKQQLASREGHKAASQWCWG